MIGESVNVVDEGVTSHMTMEPRKIQEPMNNIVIREINFKIIIIEIFQEVFNHTCMYICTVDVYLYRYMYMYLYTCTAHHYSSHLLFYDDPYQVANQLLDIVQNANRPYLFDLVSKELAP